MGNSNKENEKMTFILTSEMGSVVGELKCCVENKIKHKQRKRKSVFQKVSAEKNELQVENNSIPYERAVFLVRDIADICRWRTNKLCHRKCVKISK